MKTKIITISTEVGKVNNVQHESMNEKHLDWFYTTLFAQFLQILKDDFGFKPDIEFDITPDKKKMYIKISQTN